MQCACAPVDDEPGPLENEVLQVGDAPLRRSFCCCEPAERPPAKALWPPKPMAKAGEIGRASAENAGFRHVFATCWR